MSDIYYTKLIANNDPVKCGSNQQYRSFDELFDHYYMRLAFCALIKHIFKTDLQKDKISCAKDVISLHIQTLALKYSPEICT